MGEKDTTGGEGAGLWDRLKERFGSVAKRLGLAGEGDVDEALDHQEDLKASGKPHKKIGEILVAKGKLKGKHVDAVLKEQAKAGGTAAAGKKAAPKAAKKAKAKAAPKKAAKKPAKKAPKKIAKKAPKRGKKK